MAYCILGSLVNIHYSFPHTHTLTHSQDRRLCQKEEVKSHKLTCHRTSSIPSPEFSNAGKCKECLSMSWRNQRLWAAVASRSSGWKASGEGSVPSRREPPTGWGTSYEGPASILILNNNRGTGQGHQSPLRRHCFLSNYPLCRVLRSIYRSGCLVHHFAHKAWKPPGGERELLPAPLAPPRMSVHLDRDSLCRQEGKLA